MLNLPVAADRSQAAFVTAWTTAVVVLFLTSAIKSVVAQDDQQCSEYQFDTPFFPGSSCEDIYNKNPQSRNMPGYYWILDGPSRVYCGMNYTGSSCEDIYSNNIAIRNKSGYYRINSNEWVYCNMTAIALIFSRGDLISSCVGVGGVWKRIASFDIAAGDDCPSSWVKSSYNGVSFCRSPSDNAGCYSVIYSTNGTSYHRVCGKASGYQKGSMDGLCTRDNNLNGVYVHGLSITHGNPRQHIWAYAVGISDSGNYSCANCPCAAVSIANSPNFVGSHYYCESGAGSSYSNDVYYLSNVLWDGAGCSANNTCCSDPNLPWFYRQLGQTTQDHIEVRICTDEGFNNEALLMTELELYIQ